MTKTRYAFVGTGSRAISFVEPLVTTYRQTNELVAICDLSPTRMAYYNELLAGEMSHRVKNLLHIATALTQITKRSAATKEDMAHELTDRLRPA